MFNSKIKFAFALSFLSFFFTNCANNNDNVETTVEEDKANIEALFNDVITETEQLKAGCAVKSLDNFFNINQGNYLNSNWVDMLYTNLKNHLNITAYQTNKFSFNNHVGTHSWNSSNQYWTHSGSPTNQIVLELPDQMGATTNSVVIKASSYTDQSVSFDNYTYWLPTAFQVSANINGSDCIAAHLKSATYDNTSFQIPVSMALDLTLSPYNFEIKANRTAPNKVNVVLVAKNGGTEKFSLDVNLTYHNANYKTLNYFNDCTMAEGEFKYGDFTMPFSADFETARSLFNPTNVQVNALFDADVVYKGKEIANLDYKKDANGYADIYIVYKDETSEDMETYYKDFIERLELVVVEFTGAWPN